MQCQSEMMEILSAPAVLLRAFDSVDPEDLKGLREWVTAKRIEEIKTKVDNTSLYYAPWRIG
jgi:hypothetical protein